MDRSSGPNIGETGEGHRRFRVAGMPIEAIALLVLSAAIALIRSHYQLLFGDEFGFGLFGFDRSSSITRLIHMELTTPISLDPIGYNVLLHTIIHFFGASAFAMRLPVICAYLLMQACLFYFVRRIATERAATFALAIPALAGTVTYSVLSRPYGLLLGLAALAMLSWQTAARRDSKRTLALVVLALSLALVVNTQYYGVLFFVPLCVAEFVRSLERRRVDVAVVASIVAGMAGLLIGMPFVKALAPFRAFHVETPSFHFITHSYLWLLVGFVSWSEPVQRLISFSAVIVVVALVAAFVHFHSRVAIRLPRAEGVFLLVLSAYPFLAYLLARFVTHYVEGRYIVPAVIGLAALLAIMAAPLLESRAISTVVLASLFVAIAGTGFLRIRSEKENSQQIMASLIPGPSTQSIMDRHPGQPIYSLNQTKFELIRYYSPSADIRSRATLVCPRPKDFQYGGGADVSRQMANMVADGLPNVVSYESASKPGTEGLFLFPGYAGDWSGRALADSDAQIVPVGQLLGADLASVRFPLAANDKHYHEVVTPKINMHP